MNALIKKLTSATLAALLFLLTLAPLNKIFAQNWMMSSPQAMSSILNGSAQNGTLSSESWTLRLLATLMTDTVLLITGDGTLASAPSSQAAIPLQPASPGLAIAPDYYGPSIFSFEKSLIGKSSGVIAYMYDNPPANSSIALFDLGQTLGFIPRQVYAQGVGFSGLVPLLPIWRAFRNISYLLLAFVMVIIGFMIIFRRNIDPHTVITIQNALPRIIITLVLITFSYAIVGLLIDLMYVALFLVHAIFTSSGLLPEVREGIFGPTSMTTREAVTTGTLDKVFLMIFPDHIVTITGDVMQALGLSGGSGGGSGPLGFFNTLNPVQFIVDFVAPGAADIARGALGLLGGFLVSLAMLFLFIRLLFLFISAYINIIVSLIFGPIQILSNAIPGTNAFNNWLRGLVGNLLVFVTAGVLFMVAMVFQEAANVAGAGGDQLWTPPYYSLFTNRTEAITALFSIGILMVIPQTCNKVRDALKAPPVIPLGLGAILSPAASTVGTASHFATQMYYLQHNPLLGFFNRGGRQQGGGH